MITVAIAMFCSIVAESMSFYKRYVPKKDHSNRAIMCNFIVGVDMLSGYCFDELKWLYYQYHTHNDFEMTLMI
jgi:hypothetical protein